MILPRLTHSLRASSRVTSYTRPTSLLTRPFTSPQSSIFLHKPFSPISRSTRPYATENTNPQHSAQQDRQKINTDANEYSKSGTDDTTAGNEDAAFNTDTPKPEDAKDKAGEGNEVNPLDASPANAEISGGTRESDGRRKSGET